jgi:hypothetical protein
MAMKLAIAFLLMALSFPGQFFGEFPPHSPEPERYSWEDDRSWFHNTKNYATETVRADVEFWTKCMLFVILLQSTYIVVRR